MSYRKNKAAWLLILFIIGFLGGCSVDPQGTAVVESLLVLFLLFSVPSLILFFVGLYRGIRKKQWGIFSGSCGAILGILIGMATILSVPEEVQYMVIGGIFGMGTDWAVTLGSVSGPKTAIDSLATLISETGNAIKNAAIQTDIQPRSSRNITIFLWTVVLVVLLMLLIAKALGPILIEILIRFSSS